MAAVAAPFEETVLIAKKHDIVIAGGGSAASVAAMRLVRDYGLSVLIIERGPRSTARLMAFPAGYMKYLARDDFLEMHHTAPQPQLGGRGPIVPVAKALGGGSAVNAMVYMRGQREDYDGWAAYLGNETDWSYADMLGHFKGIEANSRFNDDFHGIGGNLRVSEPRHICDTTEDFLRAAQALGHPYNPDFNGARQNGVGIMQHTFGQWGRYTERSDAKKAFLDPLDGDPRLDIVTDARVDRILIENGRAVGVAYVHNGVTHQAYAEREVLVASGTYNSAKLMMLSGLGPADHLREHGIDGGAGHEQHRRERVGAALHCLRGPRIGDDSDLAVVIQVVEQVTQLVSERHSAPPGLAGELAREVHRHHGFVSGMHDGDPVHVRILEAYILHVNTELRQPHSLEVMRVAQGNVRVDSKRSTQRDRTLVTIVGDGHGAERRRIVPLPVLQRRPAFLHRFDEAQQLLEIGGR